MGVQRLFARRGVPTADLLDIFAELRRAALEIELVGEPPECRDEKDRIYLHCAVLGYVDWLITRDQDLLVRDGDPDTKPVRIVTPEEFIRLATELKLDLSV
jgi:predicted nucleic acid-binding protein